MNLSWDELYACMQRSARVWLVCLTSFIFRRAFAQHKNVHRAYWHKRSGKLLVIIGTGQPPCSRGQSGETRGVNSKGLCQNSFTHFSRFETVRKSLPTRCDLLKRNTILQIWLKLVAAIIVYIFWPRSSQPQFRKTRSSQPRLKLRCACIRMPTVITGTTQRGRAFRALFFWTPRTEI